MNKKARTEQRLKKLDAALASVLGERKDHGVPASLAVDLCDYYETTSRVLRIINNLMSARSVDLTQRAALFHRLQIQLDSGVAPIARDLLPQLEALTKWIYENRPEERIAVCDVAQVEI